MNRKLKVLDLFSGIGGFALGLDSTGFFETVKFVEKDKYCQKVLRKNFPNIPIEEDIKNVKGKEYSADVVVGGFPCQPFSVAGKQKGTNDDRYLWPEMLRLIREIKPEFVIGENVQGIINLQDGMVLRQVQDELESEGFEVQCFLIPASGIGAWHQRYRVWIVGHTEDNGCNRGAEATRREGPANQQDESQLEIWGEFSRPSQDVADATSLGVQGLWSGGEQESHSHARQEVPVRCGEDVADTISERTRGGSTWGQDAENAWQSSRGAKQWDWHVEPDVGRVANGIPKRVDRLKGLGNAIVPQIAQQIGEAIKAYY